MSLSRYSIGHFSCTISPILRPFEEYKMFCRYAKVGHRISTTNLVIIATSIYYEIDIIAVSNPNIWILRKVKSQL